MSDNKRASLTNFKSSCRVCLQQNNPLTEISLDLLKMLEHIVEVKFTDNRLPDKACDNCSKELESCSKFIKKCKNTYSALLAALEEKNAQIEYHSDTYGVNEHESIPEERNDESKAEEVVAEENTKLECAHCKETFSLKSQWMEHLKTHSFPGYKCTICGQNFKYPESLVKHKRIRHKPGSRGQTKASPRKRKSIKHLFIKIKDNGKLKLQCTLCDRILTTHSAASSHMVTHTGEKPFPCEFCGKRYSSRSSANIHVRQHTGETPYKCRVCSKGFRSSSSRKKHETVHHFIVKDEDSDTDSQNKTDKTDISSKIDPDANKVECEVCKRKIHKHGYGVHRKSHLSEKKQFICTYCNKEFQKNSHLQRHLRIHTGERPYTCEICKKTYIQDGDLKRHMNRNHSGIKQFQCQHCGKFYHTKPGLQNHVQAHSKEQKTVHTTSRLQNAPCREKIFLCMICGKGFTTNNSLKEHMMSHTGEVPHKCLICGKGYTNKTCLKQHTMRQHTGEKPYGCVICSKRFYDSKNLKKHMNKVHSVVDTAEERNIKQK